jgi:outer membrane protein assembly factor BamB
MYEPLTGPMLQRLLALKEYARALTHGDIERITAVLHAAEGDPVLERLVLEFNEAALQEDGDALRPEDFKRAEEYLHTVHPLTTTAHRLHELASSSSDLSESQATGSTERESNTQVQSPLLKGTMPPSSHPSARSRRGGSRLRSLVAVLLVGLLLAGFVELFAAHHRPVGSAATSSPQSPARTVTPTIHPRGIVVLGSASGVVLGLRAENGSVLWRYQASSSIDALVVQDQVVYFQTDKGDVAALRITDGTRLWHHDFKQDQGSPTHIFVDQGVVLVPDVRDTYALRATDGKILWRYLHTDTSFHGSGFQGFAEPLALGDGIAYLTINQPPAAPGKRWSNTMKALRATDGRPLWQYDTRGDDAPDNAVVANGIVYVFVTSVTSPMFLALRAIDGHLMWSQSTTISQQFVTLYPVNQEGLFLTTSNLLVCQRRFGDGTVVWCTPRLLTMNGSLVVMDGTVYVGVLLSNPAGGMDRGYELLALRTSNGSIRWRWYTQADSNYVGEIYFGLSGVLYVVTDHGIYALDGTNGAVVWYTKPGSGQLVIAGSS